MIFASCGRTAIMLGRSSYLLFALLSVMARSAFLCVYVTFITPMNYAYMRIYCIIYVANNKLCYSIYIYIHIYVVYIYIYIYVCVCTYLECAIINYTIITHSICIRYTSYTCVYIAMCI